MYAFRYGYSYCEIHITVVQEGLHTAPLPVTALQLTPLLQSDCIFVWLAHLLLYVPS